jgi:hypothetical protein
MLVTLLGMITLVRPVSANAQSPMLATFVPIVTLVSPAENPFHARFQPSSLLYMSFPLLHQHPSQ